MSKSMTYTSPYGDGITYRQPFRWRDDPLYETRRPAKIVYDDIVDDTDFHHLKEQNRLTRLSQEGAGQGQGNGIFDFDGKKDIPNDCFTRVSDAEIALREGRLDKADVTVLQKQFEAQSKKELSDLDARKVSEKEKKISQERQEFIDRELGFSPVSESVNSPNGNG